MRLEDGRAVAEGPLEAGDRRGASIHVTLGEVAGSLVLVALAIASRAGAPPLEHDIASPSCARSSS